LPPGMPYFEGSEALAEYLTANSIRYVAYDYATEVGYTWRGFSSRLKHPNVFPRTISQLTFDFQASLAQLGERRKRIYDDGSTFVLDLSQRLPLIRSEQ